jgi:hypothetical protein
VYANRYGVGAGLFAVPFVAAAYPFARDFYDRPSAGVLWFSARVAVSCAVAASAVLLFLAALPWLRPGTAAGLALAYGLGTCVWSSSSQTLWQHGPMEFFLALGTYFFLQRERPRAAYWVGLSYTLAFVCRPTAALALAAAAIYYLMRDRRALLRAVAGALPAALLLAGYNLHYFGSLLVLGQMNIGGAAEASAQLPAEFTLVPMAMAAPVTPVATTVSRFFGTSLLEGLAGLLLSPSRGLLTFSPAIGFAFWGLVRAFRDSRFSALRPVGLAALALFLVAARWFGWAGGWCYGPRLLVDGVTLLAFLAIPVAEEIRRRRPLAVAFGVCFTWAAPSPTTSWAGTTVPFSWSSVRERKNHFSSPTQTRPGARRGREAARSSSRRSTSPRNWENLVCGLCATVRFSTTSSTFPPRASSSRSQFNSSCAIEAEGGGTGEGAREARGVWRVGGGPEVPEGGTEAGAGAASPHARSPRCEPCRRTSACHPGRAAGSAGQSGNRSRHHHDSAPA